MCVSCQPPWQICWRTVALLFTLQIFQTSALLCFDQERPSARAAVLDHCFSSSPCFYPVSVSSSAQSFCFVSQKSFTTACVTTRPLYAVFIYPPCILHFSPLFSSLPLQSRSQSALHKKLSTEVCWETMHLSAHSVLNRGLVDYRSRWKAQLTLVCGDANI